MPPVAVTCWKANKDYLVGGKYTQVTCGAPDSTWPYLITWPGKGIKVLCLSVFVCVCMCVSRAVLYLCRELM